MKTIYTLFSLTFFLTIHLTILAGTEVQKENSLLFVENTGQWEEAVLFKSDLSYGSLFLEKNALTFAFYLPDDLEAVHELKHSRDREALQNFMIHAHAFSLRFLNANEDPGLRGMGQKSTYHNYFLGDDPSKWRGAVPVYDAVHYADIYPGIDIKIYSWGLSSKYDFIVAASVDPNLIEMEYAGADEFFLDEGKIVIKTSVGDFREMAPFAYQIRNGRKVEVPCNFILQNNIIGFEFPDGYDQGSELIIDPVLIGASYSGMAGSSQYGFTATYDDDGNIYGGGEAFGMGFPSTLGAYQVSFAGGVDIAITKFNEDASAAIYATYIGGSATDLPHSMIVDADGNLLVMGTTTSNNFPSTAGAYDPSFNGGTDIYVSRLSGDGSSLLQSTFIGGANVDGVNYGFYSAPSYGDESRGEVNLDGSGNVYVASATNSSDFPVTLSAFQLNLSGFQDACVFKLTSDLSSLIYSTYLGGTEVDAGCALKVKSGGEVVCVGVTESTDFPTTGGVLAESSNGGETDGFVCVINTEGTSLLYSTYIGTSGQDLTYFVELDQDENIFISGNCEEAFPVSSGVYTVAGSTQYIAALESDLSAYIWSTVVGSEYDDPYAIFELVPTAFLVDNCGNIYLRGFTSQLMPVTPDAYQTMEGGSGDFYFVVLEPEASGLLYATYVGGSGWEHVDGGTSRYSKEGIIYQASCTSSADFPVTAGAAYPTVLASGWDRVVFKFDFEFAGVAANFQIEGDITFGCAPLDVNFINLSNGADNYFWDFGTGDISNDFEPSYTFADTGTYTIMLVANAEEASECGTADTSYLTIVVGDNMSLADFVFTQNCDSLSVSFENLSANLGAASFFWDFGDGASSTASDPSHIYDEPGSYVVTLVASDPASCALSDTIQKTVTIGESLSADFTFQDFDCAPAVISFEGISNLNPTYSWTFGEFASSDVSDPVIEFDVPGTFEVILIVQDPSSCNLADTSIQFIEVEPAPLSAFQYFPLAVTPQNPVQFENLSVDASSYQWDFGDGNSSTETSPEHTFTYSGVYNVCLTAFGETDCSDEYCTIIEVGTLLVFPNAFSPNQDGINDIFRPVSGAGISNYELRIYNRWGEMIFLSNDINTGWDGIYKSREQEIGSYVYVVEFTDEKPSILQGSLTLIR